MGSWGTNRNKKMDQEKDITKLIQNLSDQISSMQSKLPNGELRIIQMNIEELKQAQSEIKSDLSDMKKKLLDPDNGVIVKVNENTRFREEQQRERKDYQEILMEHAELVKWKGSVTKALWIIFSALVGILTKMFFIDK